MSLDRDIRLLAIDLDGTLLGQGASMISVANAEALRQAAGIGVEVVPVSARPPFGIEHALRNFSEYYWLVAYNGALIFDRRTRTVLFDQPIDPIQARQAIQLMLDHDIYIACYVKDDYYIRKDCPEAQIETNAMGRAPWIKPDLCSLNQQGIHKLLTLSLDGPERLQQFYDHAIQSLQGINTVFTSPYSVEMTHAAVSKGSALRWLARQWGVSSTQVMAVGDNYNDISMFSVAGLSVAIGGAPVEVQQQAHWVAPPVGQDGAAAAVRRYILDRLA